MLVFVYGTLTEPDRAAEVVGHADYDGAATLWGLHRVEGAYPTLAPGGSVDGRLLRVDAADLPALDAYEGVDRGLYVRVSVPLADGGEAGGRPSPDRGSDGGVETYVGDPAALDAPADWPAPGPFAERVRRYVEREAVRVGRM